MYWKQFRKTGQINGIAVLYGSERIRQVRLEASE
jgi:hypothetical protein